MEAVASCPACGEEGSLDSKFDAWARYQIIGIDSTGGLKLSSCFDTQAFDYSEIECSSCGKKFTEQQVLDHLRSSA
jgi:predicted nucleic-acid-binding Zn-ribbon protein